MKYCGSRGRFELVGCQLRCMAGFVTRKPGSLAHGLSKYRPVFVIAVVLMAVLAGSCSGNQETEYVPPFVPPEYYGCYEVGPDKLVDFYFSNYGNMTQAKSLYNDQIFIFKNVKLYEWMIGRLDEGWIWVDLVKCYLVNVEDMRQFEPGDRIDVVGKNQGPPPDLSTGLIFTGCIVLPAGVVALPADPGSGVITPGY